MMSALTLARSLSHPPEKVWRALTEGQILADWLFPNDFRAVAGQAFTFRSPAQPHWNGVITGTVLELERPQRLVIRWQADGVDGAPPLDTVVTFRLEPAGTGTLLHLQHEGFLPGQARNRSGAEAGWPRFLDRLDLTLQRLEGAATCKPG